MTSGPRRFDGDVLVVASHNEGKVREIRDLLRPYDVETKSSSELKLGEPVEDGATFIDNAVIKASETAKASGLPSLADDSGLEVHALDGDPGIYSARWAGPDKNFQHAMEQVEQKLTQKGAFSEATRRANFVCALCLAWPDGHQETFEGKVFGHLTWPPRGNNGFGYDPVFVPDGDTRTFGEFDPDEKHAMSHRANAFRNLVDACFKTS